MDKKEAIKNRVIGHILEMKENMYQDFIELTNLEVAEALAIYDDYEMVYSAMKSEKLGGLELVGAMGNNADKMRYYKRNKYNFRKILAAEEIFKKTKTDNKDDLEDFQSFAESQTVKSGKAKGGTSGKARSYMMYLVRLFILANEKRNIEMNSVEFFNELSLIKKHPNFREYNSSEKRFPSGTINAYLKYWLTKAFEEDNIFDNPIISMDEKSTDVIQIEQVGSKEKPKKIIVNNKEVYVRDSSVIKYAKEKAAWLCEVNPTHDTFINKYNGFPYVEAHHLIPMALQDNFNYSLDVPSNIISVCPNCHRMVHYGMDSDKEKILQKIYQQRNDHLILAGIRISYKKLLLLYVS
ncbi:MAG TPA: HNH endonuclease [Epulopiscium sp.]|nr:HNH endonuclease [Candidatus Epulonipiscium sp.]